MNADPITWERLRDIFGDPPLVMRVTEQQFDNNDDMLQKLGRTPHDEVDLDDLWCYHHDLAFVELQPELFAHLFPVCLMDWHRTLQTNQACSHGDSKFHYGVVQGNIFEKMLTEKQRQDVEAVFHDSMQYRLDQERGFIYDGMHTPAYYWVARLNSLALIMNASPQLWKEWWSVTTPGRAVCVFQYCASLMYFEDENPLFEIWDTARGPRGPVLASNNSYVYHRGWLKSNLRFIRDFVTTKRVFDAVRAAATKLRDEPEGRLAARIANDVDDRYELIESRVSDLPNILAMTQADWSV